MSTSNEVTVALGGKLPPGDGNGLAGMGHKLTETPEARKQIRAAVILFDVAEVAEKTDDGALKAKLRVRRIEVVSDPGDFEIMSRLLLREFERRTGQTALPFELEQDVESLLKEAVRKDPWIGKRTYPPGDATPPPSADDNHDDREDT